MVSAAIARLEADDMPIAALINNAEITRDGVTHRMDSKDFDAVIRTNLSGAFNLC